MLCNYIDDDNIYTKSTVTDACTNIAIQSYTDFEDTTTGALFEQLIISYNKSSFKGAEDFKKFLQ